MQAGYFNSTGNQALTFRSGSFIRVIHVRLDYNFR
jgi:hypothetical protein